MSTQQGAGGRTTDHTSKRRHALQMQQPVSPTTVFDRLIFLVGTASAAWLAVIFGVQGVRSPWALALFVPVWGITAYLVLPRLHKLLSDMYVPDYFFGRTRTSDGLLGDPVNMGVDGSAEQLDAVMLKGGWYRADEITAGSTWRIITSTLTRKSYPTAPVSPLMLFNRRHDVAYQQEVEGNPKQRHHVRFWHCPPGWLLPGGAKTDWLGAGTYDTDVGLSFFTLQVTHRIDENTDEERDYVVSSAQAADPDVSVRLLEDFTTGYHSRNGGGDRFITDGNLPIIDVSAVQVLESPRTSPQTAAQASSGAGKGAAAHSAFAVSSQEAVDELVERTPLSVVAAAIIIVLSALIDLVSFMVEPEVKSMLSATGTEGQIAFWLLAGISGALTLSQIVMAWFVVRRGRRSRFILLFLLILGVVTTAVNYLQGNVSIGFNGTLLSASLMCLALLSLSSESASAWSRPRDAETVVEQ